MFLFILSNWNDIITFERIPLYSKVIAQFFSSLRCTAYVKFLMITNKNFARNRSSRPEVFCKKGVFRNFAKFTGKHLCQKLFFNKVAGLRPATLLKKSLWHRCFPVNFAKFLRTPPVAASEGK